MKLNLENKSIFFTGNLDYLFNAFHDPTNEPTLIKDGDNTSLANFIYADDNIKWERGWPRKELKEKRTRKETKRETTQ